jgi:ribosomal protein S16
MLEILGYWYPKKDLFKVDKKGIENWIKKGALVSKAVQKLIT